MSRRAGTAWDATALRWSTLYGHDSLPSHTQIPSLRTVYGVRNVPIGFSFDQDNDNSDPCGSDERLDDGNFASSSKQLLESPRKAKQNTPVDLAFQTIALRGDILPSNQVLEGCIGKTGLLRRRRRVVDGAIERHSAYWSSKRSRHIARGPMRSRVPLVGRDLERLLAYSRRTTCLRTDRGTTRRSMAIEARISPISQIADNAPTINSASGSVTTSDANPPSSPDVITQKSRKHLLLLPTVFPWTEQDESKYWKNEFGWVYADQRSSLIPDSSTLTAMHYYVGKLFETRGQLPAATCAADMYSNDSTRSEDQDEMVVGDNSWDFWAQYSLGAARSMLQAFDSSALVALTAYLEEYTKAGTFRAHLTQHANDYTGENDPGHDAPLQQDDPAEYKDKSSQLSSKALRDALKCEQITTHTHRKKIPKVWLEQIE
ncbi:hypothetical protein MPSI1_001321 [Malassezia psittaci]|uniref:Uncharacterized protein n=1 Tax=Malassezia psittaci TaxID=1821823 RepID=A0AAF0JDI0_9BASI|nr:hypothetical protein MPSI1_001321 [Malassezia psittaci]